MEKILGSCLELGMNKSERNRIHNFEGDVCEGTYVIEDIWILVSHINVQK